MKILKKQLIATLWMLPLLEAKRRFLIDCTTDVKLCDDGVTYVSRDPDNGCEFEPCPEDQVYCTQDVKLCDDGVTYVTRDPENDCNFMLCPEDQVLCTKDAKLCEDGKTYVSRDPDNDCAFKTCPTEDPIICTADAKLCPDGSYVGRVPPDCEFEECPSSNSNQITKCFSGMNTVQTRDKGNVKMLDLKVGDFILVDISEDNNLAPLFEPIYAFGHLQLDIKAEFLQIRTNSDHRDPLEVTKEHLVYIKGKENPVRADAIQIGDILQTERKDEEAQVTSIGKVTREGLFAPLVPSGTLVVSGIKASSYVSLQEDAIEYVQYPNGISTDLSQHDFMHLAITPFRMVCSTGLSIPPVSGLCQSYDDTTGTPYFVSYGIQMINWILELRLPLCLFSFLLVSFRVCFSPLALIDTIYLSVVSHHSNAMALVPLLCFIIYYTSSSRTSKQSTQSKKPRKQGVLPPVTNRFRLFFHVVLMHMQPRIGATSMLDNDNCTNTVLLTVQNSLLSGSLKEATFDTVPSCAAVVSPQEGEGM